MAWTAYHILHSAFVTLVINSHWVAMLPLSQSVLSHIPIPTTRLNEDLPQSLTLHMGNNVHVQQLHVCIYVLKHTHIPIGKDCQSQRIDEMNLIQTFRYLGYIVEVHRDRSDSESGTSLMRYPQGITQNTTASLAVFSLTEKKGESFAAQMVRKLTSLILRRSSTGRIASFLTRNRTSLCRPVEGVRKTCMEIDINSDEPQGYNPMLRFNEADFFFWICHATRECCLAQSGVQFMVCYRAV